MRFETDIPEGQSGQWKVEKLAILQEGSSIMLFGMISGITFVVII